MSVLERIWENTELYQLIRGYPGGIILFGLRGEILEVNDAFVELLGCSESTLYEKKYTDISSTTHSAAEAAILKSQAFVRGYTDGYQKKYELNGRSVLVSQHTYLIKDRAGNPEVMVAMIHPALPGSDEGTLNQSMRQLEAENARLRDALAAATALDAMALRRTVSQLQETLSMAQETIAALERTIVTKDAALALKDAALEKMAAARAELEQALRDARGALEVDQILASGGDGPNEPFLPAGPLPDIDGDDRDSPEEAPPDEPTDAADADAPEKAALMDAPWEADDVVYDDAVLPPEPESV